MAKLSVMTVINPLKIPINLTFGMFIGRMLDVLKES